LIAARDIELRQLARLRRAEIDELAFDVALPRIVGAMRTRAERAACNERRNSPYDASG
jgi:hypothetical protein